MYLLLYHTSTSTTTNIDDISIAWWILFKHRGWKKKIIAATHKALKLTCSRGSMFKQALEWLSEETTYFPIEWGLRKFGEQYIPFWSDLRNARKFCGELIKCSCKKSCKGESNCCKQEISVLNCAAVHDSAKSLQNRHTCSL